MNLLAILTGGNASRMVMTALIAAALAAAGTWRVQEWRWQANTLKAENARQQADVQGGIANAQETLRRLDRQKVNQDVQVKEITAARSAAGRNGTDADRLREQNVAIAKQWRDALGNPAAGNKCPAAGDAIGVLADVLGRADRRAGELASYADTARAAGSQCERDYDALTAVQASARPPSGRATMPPD